MKALLLAGGVALLVAMLGTPLLIGDLRARGIGQQIREDGPAGHFSKAGTPTMGGLAIMAAAVVGWIVAHVFATFTTRGLAGMLTICGAALVGFIDDWLKNTRQRSLGLNKRAKIVGQLVVALAFALATPAWSTASRSMWQHGPSMLCIAVGLLCALRAQAGQRGWAGMGAAFAASYAMRPTDSIVIIVMAVWVVVSQRRHVMAVVAGAIPPMAILVGVDLVYYHQPLTPYYTGGQAFDVSGTMAVALAGNLVSPARGLFIFCPLVVLSVAGVVVRWRAGELTAFWKALAVIPVLHWIVISAFKHWWGGDSFGPRFFTDLMPVLVVLALPAVEVLAGWMAPSPARPGRVYPAPEGSAEVTPVGTPPRLRWRRVVVALAVVALVWSFAVNAQGAILRSAWCWNNEPTDVDTHPGKLWDWSDAQFDRGIRTLVWGPDRSSELVRDGVDLLGCPSEPVRP